MLAPATYYIESKRPYEMFVRNILFVLFFPIVVSYVAFASVVRVQFTENTKDGKFMDGDTHGNIVPAGAQGFDHTNTPFTYNGVDQAFRMPDNDHRLVPGEDMVEDK